jgi:segregation and condensation protein A
LTDEPPIEAPENGWSDFNPDDGAAFAAPLVVELDGYEGPLDVLLALARTQKVDIAKISILALAEQFLDFIAEARRLRLEVAADYLVMAAWLAYLKSKLLLPDLDDDDEPSGPELAARLTWQLKRIEAFREVGGQLMARDRLGRDVFKRGQPEGVRQIRTSTYEVTLFELLRAYAIQKESKGIAEIRLPQRQLYSVEQALERLSKMIGGAPGWERLESFLPPDLRVGPGAKSALAATLSASLELAKVGKLTVSQSKTFGPIYLKRSDRHIQESGEPEVLQDNRDPADINPSTDNDEIS